MSMTTTPSQAVAASKPAAGATPQRWRTLLPWLAGAALLLLLPLRLNSGTALTVMSLMGIAIIYSLSFNILLGQTGMLSFGPAVYYGLGAYFVVHAMNTLIAAKVGMPLPLLPIVGGLAGLFFAIIFGWVSTKRSGTAFSMISLGLAELVGSSSLILRTFFGGEEGVSTNRTQLGKILGINFGPQIQIYYLIAVWCLVAAILMYALTRTPFGRMCNAVRDNPERAQFIGYNPQIVRYLAFCISGFFAGIAGGLAAINFELANAALFSASNSGTVLLATFVGGIGTFIGPILGAVLVSYLQIMLSDITEVWQLYFGIMFICVVMFAPGGIAGLFQMHRPFWKAGSLGQILPSYAVAIVPAAMIFVGLALIIEMTVQLCVKHSEGPAMKMFGFAFNAATPTPWAISVGLIALGALAFRFVGPMISNGWDRARAAAREKGIVV
jgi:branched-chain amino acid transport system permease protein